MKWRRIDEAPSASVPLSSFRGLISLARTKKVEFWHGRLKEITWTVFGTRLDSCGDERIQQSSRGRRLLRRLRLIELDWLADLWGICAVVSPRQPVRNLSRRCPDLFSSVPAHISTRRSVWVLCVLWLASDIRWETCHNNLGHLCVMLLFSLLPNA